MTRTGQKRLRIAVGALTVMLVTVLLVALPSTNARFLASTSGPANHFTATTAAPPTGLTATAGCSPSAGPLTFVASTRTPFNSGVDTYTGAKPAGTTSGHLLLAQLVIRFDSASYTPPAGWALLRRDDYVGGFLSQMVYYKVATASEPADYTWTTTTGAKGVLTILAYSGVDPTAPVAVHGGAQAANSTSISAPTLNAPSASNILVTLFATRSSTTVFAAPTGMSSRGSGATSGGSANLNAAAGAADLVVPAGATGARQGTFGASATNLVAAAIVLTSAPARGPMVTLSWTPPAAAGADTYTVRRYAGASLQATRTLAPVSMASFQEMGLSSSTSFTFHLEVNYGSWKSSTAIAQATTATC